MPDQVRHDRHELSAYLNYDTVCCAGVTFILQLIYRTRHQPRKIRLRRPPVTRLITTDISDIAANLKNYDAELIARTGYSLSGIACRAAEIDEAQIRNLLPEIRVGVIPISSGEGIISGFGDAVLSILLHMGAKTFVSRAKDIAGIVESFEKKADIVMLADDERFVALHIQSRSIADNGICTGNAFATGLGLMAGGLEGREVLVIGCGPVGGSATEFLVRMGARISVYDVHKEPAKALTASIHQRFDTKIRIVKKLEPALRRHKCILDASPAGNIIHAQHITPDTYVSAPGMPSGLDPEAKTAISNRYLHDPLQLGVATMLVGAVKYHFEHRQ
jgi:pyrrolysine biosynthesis protein PylD